MTPEQFDDWVDAAQVIAFQRVRDRLKHYPLLWAAAAGVAEQSVRQAVRLARGRVTERLAFENKYMFVRWLVTVADREALRLLLEQPSVARWLAEVPADDRRVLRFLYVDQLNFRELAQVLYLNPDGARSRAFAAYDALCRVLRNVGLKDDDWTFPMFPAGVGWVGPTATELRKRQDHCGETP